MTREDDFVDHSEDTLSSSWSPAGRWVAARMPSGIKQAILRRYWPLKELHEHWVEYLLELIGYVPVHAIRIFVYKHIGKVTIGPQSSIHRRCRFYAPWRVTIGHNTVINRDVLLDGRSSLVIGNNVSISEGTIILSLGHDVDAPDFALKGSQVTIEDYVFIGSYARILPSVTIGRGAVIGVGAVVTKDISPYTVAAGIPAQRIRERSCDLTYMLHYRKPFG